MDEAGQPKVLDFGVAHATDADLLTAAGLTRTGQLLGTPNYMSPEQVTGDPAAIDRRTDVYALGVILFELLAHRLPYQLENRPLAEAARLILEQDPPRLGSLDPELRDEVETIVAKALEKDPARRYTSAADLAADLQRWLNHQPILARPPSAMYHLRKFARRNKGLVGGAVAALAALVLGLIGTILFAVGEAHQRGLAEQNAQAARDEKREAQFQAYRARLSAAVAALQNHDVTDAARHLDAAPEALRGWEWRHLRSRLDDSIAVIPAPHSGIALSPGPQGLRLVILADQSLRLLDEQGRVERTVSFPHENESIWAVAQAPEGLLILDRVSGTIARVRDTTGTVRVNVPMPAGRHNLQCLARPQLETTGACLAIPGRVMRGRVRLLGERTGPSARISSRPGLVAGFQPRRHATGFGLGRRYRPAVGCSDRPADEWPAAPSGQRQSPQRSVPPRRSPRRDHLGRWHGMSVGRQNGSCRRAAL